MLIHVRTSEPIAKILNLLKEECGYPTRHAVEEGLRLLAEAKLGRIAVKKTVNPSKEDKASALLLKSDDEITEYLVENFVWLPKGGIDPDVSSPCYLHYRVETKGPLRQAILQSF